MKRTAALEYLSNLCQRIAATDGVQTAFVAPFVVAWWNDANALGFVVEVWMTPSVSGGGWDIVDRSAPLYQPPGGLKRLLA